MLDEPRTHELLELLAGRWTVAVLSELREKGRRYQDLDDAIEGISHKILTDTLPRAVPHFGPAP
jgi:DNA-binding HxlR family transcriptional regulator